MNERKVMTLFKDRYRMRFVVLGIMMRLAIALIMFHEEGLNIPMIKGVLPCSPGITRW